MDAAVIDFHGRYLVAKTDPITFVSDDIGAYAIHVNANDIAVMGGTPRWFLAAILLPEGRSTVKSASAVFTQISRACRAVGVSLCGGHTEVTAGIERPIVVGQMLGEVEKKRLVTAAGVRPGDAIILTKGIAIEAVSIMARVRGKEIERRFGKAFLARCKAFIRRPGLSVIADAKAAMGEAGVNAMHDPTEGGLSSGLHEMALASSCGIVVERSEIRVLPEAGALCAHFGLDPMGAIASGALIVSVDQRRAPGVLRGLKKAGIAASVIGRAARRGGVRISENGKTTPLKPFEQDEITKIL
jgi:hydrogenase maturation factor